VRCNVPRRSPSTTQFDATQALGRFEIMSHYHLPDGSARPCSPRSEHVKKGQEMHYSIFGWANGKESLPRSEAKDASLRSQSAPRPRRVAGIQTKPSYSEWQGSKRPYAARFPFYLRCHADPPRTCVARLCP
jgi:hypothetical protein